MITLRMLRGTYGVPLGYKCFLGLAMALLLSSPLRAQQIGGTCGAMLRTAMQDTVAFARVAHDLDTASTPIPITVIDSAFATLEQVRILREPGNLERMASKVDILRRTTAERIVGRPLRANVICISTNPG